MVLIPASSKHRASTLTVCVQSGQVGVRNTTSTPSSSIRRATSGPVSVAISVVSRCAPHERVVIVGQRPYYTLLEQLLQPVDGVGDVDVTVDAGMVKANAGMALNNLRGRVLLGSTRYEESPLPRVSEMNSLSPLRCSPAEVTNATRLSLRGFRMGVQGASSCSAHGYICSILRCTSLRVSSLGIFTPAV